MLHLSIENVSEREIDAALYILDRILGSPQIGANLFLLQDLRRKIKETRFLTQEDRSSIMTIYHEIYG